MLRRWLERVNAAAKFLLSFRKRTWALSDYPIRISNFEPVRNRYGDPPYTWSAEIINWWSMAGFGQSRSEALVKLNLCFAQRASGPLPRPGTAGPISFASTARIEGHRALAADFLERVLHLRYDECFMSDGTSLWDFHDEDTNEKLNERIVASYGVDVLDMQTALLVDVFDRIEAKRAR